MIVAIDGPAASGKGTLAKKLAAHYGLPHLDSGLLYRAAEALDAATLGDPALRGRHAGEGASIVSAHPGVRAALLAFQRDFARQPPGAVLDGRDIGTVICPEAEVKIFVTASPQERARRRARELGMRGESVDEVAILADIKARDARDMNRAVAPLKPAEDAVELDTTSLDADAAFQAAVAIVEARREVRKRA